MIHAKTTRPKTTNTVQLSYFTTEVVIVVIFVRQEPFGDLIKRGTMTIDKEAQFMVQQTTINNVEATRLRGLPLEILEILND